jgi:hypothetical protein
MVSKCANPGCSAPFLYLHRGKLFRFEVESAGLAGTAGFGADPEIKHPPRRIEFFWLCPDCAASMTLTRKENAGVTTVPLALSRAAVL